MLRHDAIAPLLDRADAALGWAVGRDLLDEPLAPQSLWELPEVERIVRRQLEDGAWPYGGGLARIRPREDYAQLATFQQLRTLCTKFRLDRRHPAIERAAEFLLAHQTGAGDIRGIYGSQYSPNYTADMLALLIGAGFRGDERVTRGMEWLLSMRQDDGGWAIPARTAWAGGIAQALALSEPLEPVRSRPSSHFATGIVLRAFAAHPGYRRRREARHAAAFLASRFFKPDAYADHGSAACWTKLTFPFRWTDLVSALDAVALIDGNPARPDVAGGLDWLVQHQRPSGLWLSGYPKTSDPLVHHWVTFAVVRVLKRFYGMERLIRAGARRPARRAPLRERTGTLSAV